MEQEQCNWLTSSLAFKELYEAVELGRQIIKPSLNLYHIGEATALTLDMLDEARNECKLPSALFLWALELVVIM